MPGRNYFLLSALPGLGELGSDPPIGRAELLALLDEAPRPRAQAEAIFLADDLLAREAALAGQVEAPEPLVLTAEQVRGDEPLPAWLAGAEAEPAAPAEGRLAVDAVWAAYFRHLAGVAGVGRFVPAWIALEAGLRNALAAARAKALSLDAHRYVVEVPGALPAEEFTDVLAEWSAARTPLAGLRALDAARWQWLVEHDGWFTFADDELAAYAAKLMLLHRWRRIAQAERQDTRVPG